VFGLTREEEGGKYRGIKGEVEENTLVKQRKDRSILPLS
jgi:hypothetical protein